MVRQVSLQISVYESSLKFLLYQLHHATFLLIIIFILIITYYYFFQLARWHNSLFFVQDNNNKINSFNSVVLEKTENVFLNYINLVLW